MPPIRITEVRVHRLAGDLKEAFGWSLNWTSRRTATLVEVRTDAGLTGWGDGTFGGDLLRQRPEIVIGRSPFEVEAIYEELREAPAMQRRHGPQNCGGLDTALWDLCGQFLGVPLCRLLGSQARNRVQPYYTGLYRKERPDLAASLAEEARSAIANGFRILKMKIGYGPAVDVSIVRAVREAIGADAGLAVDSNCAYDSGVAVALGREMEPFGLLWWEEPVLADDFAGYARLRDSLRMPLAGGETFLLDQLIEGYVQRRLVDILQPEVELIGLTGARRLTHLCWLNRIRLVPHNWGTAVRTAAILHWMATAPPITEGLHGPPALFEMDQTEHPFRDAVAAQPPRLGNDGLVAVPDGPGLGIRVVPEAVEAFRTELIRIA